MPLSVKARVEVYLPDLPKPDYQKILQVFAKEFIATFGGCTIIRGIEGHYLSNSGKVLSDRINLIYSDTLFDFQENFSAISNYTDRLRETACEGLEEESILVAVWQIYHSI